MKTLFVIVISSAFLFTVAGCEDEASTQKIKDLIKAYETALNVNDTDGLMDLYGSDPVFMPQHSAALEKRDAVRAGYEHVFSIINAKREIHCP